MAALLTLECPSCGGKSRFTPGIDRFVCDYCGNTHIFILPLLHAEGGMGLQKHSTGTDQKPYRRIAPLPSRLIVEKKGRSLRLSWHWLSLDTLKMIFFSIAWGVFLVFWYSKTLTPENLSWSMVGFFMGHLAVGVGIIYSALASLLNTTTVYLDTKFLVVHHDPVPWPGEVKVPITDLAQLFCQVKRKSSNETGPRPYRLCAVMKDGRKIELVSNLISPELAAYLEQEIETWLNIPNYPVVGEALA